MTDPVYLDYNATTPVAPEVVDAMLPYLREHFGNPSSSHVYGRRAREAVAEARARVAALIGATPEEIVFTGSATEANNLALLGSAATLLGRRNHVVISAIEHPAVMAPIESLRGQGWDASIVPVDAQGRVQVQDVAQALREDTALVSIMHANNEIGTIQPVREIADVARRRNILLHTDAAQTVGKIAVDVDALGVDLLTLAGHKFYAPKGIGALYRRTGTQLQAVSHGAGQEDALRPGTENVAAIVGLGAAALLAQQRLAHDEAHWRELRDLLHAHLAATIPGLALNGHPGHRLPNTLHVSFPRVTGKDLLRQASDAVAASVGSACHAEGEAVSGVMAAIGADAARTAGAVRLSVGRTTRKEDVLLAATSLTVAWQGLVRGQP